MSFLRKFFAEKHAVESNSAPVYIVSGLPRSGTSMMMRMLSEGGLPILTDELRRADDDNPNGYFELEVVRQLKEGNLMWLKEANGKCVKVISSLLEYLPPEYHYKIIFMERDPRETLVSQKKMLDHRGETPKISDQEMEQQFQKHLAAMKPWLIRQPNMQVLYVNYNALMAEPASACERIVQFLGVTLNRSQMMSVPNKQLYRNRVVTE
jgi:sulfotransferase family protein